MTVDAAFRRVLRDDAQRRPKGQRPDSDALDDLVDLALSLSTTCRTDPGTPALFDHPELLQSPFASAPYYPKPSHPLNCPNSAFAFSRGSHESSKSSERDAHQSGGSQTPPSSPAGGLHPPGLLASTPALDRGATTDPTAAHAAKTQAASLARSVWRRVSKSCQHRTYG